MKCTCSETIRCAEAHALRDTYKTCASVPEGVETAQRYTQHLYAAGLMAYPTTAAPTWQCAEACEPDAPCRVEIGGQMPLYPA